MIRVLAAMIAMSVPAQAEVHRVPFVGLCSTNPADFEPGLGRIVRGPVLMEDNEGGFALFTIEGEDVRAVGIAMPDGLTFCILWADFVEGDPS